MFYLRLFKQKGHSISEVTLVIAALSFPLWPTGHMTFYRKKEVIGYCAGRAYTILAIEPV